MIEYIYALCEQGGAPFYVGRTKDMTRRTQEHRYASKDGTETKYQVIRNLEARGGSWEMVLLEQVGPGCERYEDFWVYSLTLEGYELANMKAGDAKQAAQQDAFRSMLGRRTRYSDARTFLDALQREEEEQRARAATARLQARLRKDTQDSDAERTLFDMEKPEERFMSPWMRERLTRNKCI